MYDLGPYIVFHHSSASAYYEEQEMGKAWEQGYPTLLMVFLWFVF